MSLFAPAAVGDPGSPPLLPMLPWPIQAKLEVGSVDDPLEREADRVAEQVMRMPEPRAAASATMSDVHYDQQSQRVGELPKFLDFHPVAAPAGVQRKCSCGGSCDKCKAEQSDEEHGKVQRKPAAPLISRVASSPSPTGMAAPPIIHEVLRSPGQPLDAATRAFFEPRFGWDFSRVRVHSNGQAADSAGAVRAQAYTAGNNLIFASGRFSPTTTEGRRLLAHELTHVLQQGVQIVGLQRAPSEALEVSPKSVVDRHILGLAKDYEGLAAELHGYIKKGDYSFVKKAFEHIKSDDEDNVAAELVNRMSRPGLDRMASSYGGRATLTVLYEAMVTGDVSPFQREQARRILVATRLSKSEYIAQMRHDIVVFPIQEQGLFHYCNSAFRATLLPSGKVRTEFTGARIWQCYPEEEATFRPYGGIDKSQEFEPDALVGVRLYDKGGKFATIPALALIDLSNQLDKKTGSLMWTAILTGLTFGVGALGGAAVATLEAQVAAGEATGAVLWGARILLWADRVAAVLPVLTETANENRDWIIEKVPHGAGFLDALEKANAIAGYYGYARLGFDGLIFMKTQMAAAWEIREMDGVPGSLDASERESLGQIDVETKKVLKQLTDAEAAIEEAAVESVNKHPESVRGEPGKRHADVGAGHEIVEVPGGGCELRSPSGVSVPCPKPMDTHAEPSRKGEPAGIGAKAEPAGKAAKAEAARGDPSVPGTTQRRGSQAAAQTAPPGRQTTPPASPPRKQSRPRTAKDVTSSGTEPLRPGKSELGQYGIDKYSTFSNRPSDKFAGHELLQNLWLEVKGYGKRLVGPASRNNPAVALTQAEHTAVGRAQRNMGLFDRKKLAGMSAERVIDANAQAMKRAGIPDYVIETLKKEALEYATTLKPLRGSTR